MYESVRHLNSTKSNGFDHGSLLPFIFQINCLGDHWLVRLSLLDVDAEVDDKAKDFVITMIDGAVQWGQALVVLYL